LEVVSLVYLDVCRVLVVLCARVRQVPRPVVTARDRLLCAFSRILRLEGVGRFSCSDTKSRFCEAFRLEGFDDTGEERARLRLASAVADEDARDPVVKGDAHARLFRRR
jgi:hypothetical protein